MVIFSDEEIAEFIKELKILPDDYYDVLINGLKTKGPCKRSNLSVQGVEGNIYHINIRQSIHQSRDFSVILRVEQSVTTGDFILRRYNGPSHWHTNPLENGESFRGYHVHYATERYQKASRKPEHFAVETNSYSDIVSALECMINECGFQKPTDDYKRLV